MPLQQINVSPLGDYPNPQDYYQPGGGTAAKRCDSAASSVTASSLATSGGGDMCRICHCEGDSDAPLIAPCYCAGSLRFVHQQCLQQWIKSSNIRSCELCKFQFIMQTKVKPFSEWEHLEMSGFERRKLFCAVMFHAVALTCVVWSLYVLIDRTADEIQNGLLEWPFWTKLVVVAIGFTGGVVFMYIQCKAYLQICQRWKAFNRCKRKLFVFWRACGHPIHWEHLEMSGFERRKLFCAVMFHAVALTCVVWSLYVLIDRTADEIQNGLLEWPFWTKLVVVAIGFTGGVVFMYIQCKAYLQICQRWKAFNRVIYVQNAPEKPSLTPSRSSGGAGEGLVGVGGGELACVVAQSSNAHAPCAAYQPQPFKAYRDGMREREDNEETSIDLKGVRNLHIFFNDEKRIQVQKDKALDPSDGTEVNGGGVDCCHGNGNNGNSQPIAGIPGCSGDNHNTGTSWHIKIGKSGGETSDDYQDTMKDDEVARPANGGGDLESPVLKLQIKKAEIVIKFGQKSTSSPSNNNNSSHIGGSSSTNGAGAPGISVSATPGSSDMVPPEQGFSEGGNTESSVNIEIDSLEKDGDDPIVIDLVHQNNRYQFPSTEEPEVVSNNSTSSNPVQITLDFGRKDSGSEGRLPEDVRLLPGGTSGDLLPTPVDDYPAPKSEPGSGSQSPLLAVRSIK
ncbi:uncharacterized protein LOC111051702 [Nilaparvata lugens]|uniref:uncharacterized protein LOC111051702 n=1 Tax=Nilaparvata lugens TaxID=108931 RepID=UPI00193DA52E|nr:uncharacterized protein LOC111051702 [Nilaparvata lugens]